MKYDAVIVGAGPAGSTCARLLAKKGHRVLLIDRAVFPREKVCGDGLTPGAAKLLNELGVLQKLSGNHIYPIRAIRFVTPKLQRLDVPFQSKHNSADFLIIPRKELDYMLLQQAISMGADFRAGIATKPLKQDNRVVGIRVKINGRESDVLSKIVIAADGASSVIARSLNSFKVRPKHRFLAIRGYVSGIQTIPNMVEFYWTKELKPGYFWIFPLNEHEANIGLGLPADLYQKSKINLKEMFFQFLNSSLFSQRIASKPEIRDLKSWLIPLAGANGIQRVFNGALLVGDAGYWVDPLSGEGIHNAIKTAMIASEVIDRALKTNQLNREFLQEYEKRAWQELGPVIRRSLRFVWGMRHTPQLLEFLFWFARRNQLMFRKFFSNLSEDFQFNLNEAKVKPGEEDKR